jgi:hypothetical protein
MANEAGRNQNDLAAKSHPKSHPEFGLRSLPVPRFYIRMSDSPKTPVSRIGRAALVRLYGREKAERLWCRGPADENNQVPVVMPDGAATDGDDNEGRKVDQGI